MSLFWFCQACLKDVEGEVPLDSKCKSCKLSVVNPQVTCPHCNLTGFFNEIVDHVRVSVDPTNFENWQAGITFNF